MTLFFFLPLSSEADNLALSSEFRIPEILGGLGHHILNEITRQYNDPLSVSSDKVTPDCFGVGICR